MTPDGLNPETLQQCSQTWRWQKNLIYNTGTVSRVYNPRGILKFLKIQNAPHQKRLPLKKRGNSLWGLHFPEKFLNCSLFFL
ncbi:MAG: hypothetical protein AYK19_07095 [Theionarchaea archaeon DG-70-1]|nr:MAG: hypothetical protein AYK19_07095 [Theionarchaea archaeon DG-70-1]